MERHGFVELRAKIAQLKMDLQTAERRLQAAEDQCPHKWGEIKYNPIEKAGYRIPSDREQGIELGIDSRPEMYVPPSKTDRWRKECALCGKVVETTHAEEKTQVTKIPRF